MAPHLLSGKPPIRHQSGFSYLLVLLLVVLMGIGLGAAGTLWSTESQRVKENDLLYIGEQYQKAISSYYTSTPNIPDATPNASGETKHYPKTLNDLLLDPRHEKLTRHLRKLYADPLTGKNEWGLVRDPVSEEISGVFSLAPGQPIKQQGFGTLQKEFAEAPDYQAWRFVATQTLPPPPVASPTPSNTGATADTF